MKRNYCPDVLTQVIAGGRTPTMTQYHLAVKARPKPGRNPAVTAYLQLADAARRDWYSIPAETPHVCHKQIHTAPPTPTRALYSSCRRCVASSSTGPGEHAQVPHASNVD